MTETRSAPTEGGGSPSSRGGRTNPALFYRQVVAELRKVIWPTRQQLLTYTGVVLVFVVIMIGYVFTLDNLFSNAVLALFG